MKQWLSMKVPAKGKLDTLKARFEVEVFQSNYDTIARQQEVEEHETETVMSGEPPY
jgi:hypothetical protein